MKKIKFTFLIAGTLWLSACSNQSTGINDESGTAGNTAQNDSSTTNPVNSEYGTPNASENKVDSVQNVENPPADN